MLAEIIPGTSVNNRYEIQKVLGQGSFGRTYLASDTQRFGDLCVLKEFLPSSRAEYVVNKSRELFAREAKVLYQINYPQIPKFLAWFSDQERLFLVQEYIDGKTYSQLLQERIYQQGEPFSEPEIIQWLKDLLPVLDYLHGINIIHRDISPENVMLPYDQSKPVLIDFGLVKETITQILSVDSNSPQDFIQASMIGKFGYAPPEQIRLGQCYPCSDLYALGVTAVVLLTGKKPNLLMDQSLDWQWHSYVNISDELTQILDKMLAQKPRDRYQFAQEILVDLQSPTLSSKIGLSLPRKKFQVTIDQAKKERQIAEIIESDDFKLLEQQADKLREKTQYSPEFLWETETDEQSISIESTISQSPEPVAITPESQLKAKAFTPLNLEFIEHCRQELVRCVGPMASFLLEDTLAQSPQLTPEQLVEALAAEIPNPQRAKEFRNRITIFVTETLQSSTLSKEKIGSQTVSLNPEFIEHCRQELVRCVGPMASFLLEDTLAQSPQLTPEQLVEALGAEIPNPQRAKEFKSRIKITPR